MTKSKMPVWWNQDKVGLLFIGHDGKISFEYDISWLELKAKEKFAGAISISMPALPERYLDAAHNFFSNFLPEGELRKAISKSLGVSDSNDAELILR